MKTCTCCKRHISPEEWKRLPPARGGLRALGMEWRNHGCGSTLAIEIQHAEALTQAVLS